MAVNWRSYWLTAAERNWRVCQWMLAASASCCLLADSGTVGGRIMPTADHNTPQRALSCQIVAGRPSECKKLILRPFLAGVLTLKTVLHPESTRTRHFHSENVLGRGHSLLPIYLPQWEGDTPPTPPSTYFTAPRPTRLRRSTLALPPLQNPRYATRQHSGIRSLQNKH